MVLKVRAAEVLAVGVSSYVRLSGSVWPNVTYPDFGALVHEMHEQSFVELTSLCPIVKDSQRQAWSEYSTENQWWIRHDLIQEGDLTTDPGEVSPLKALDENTTGVGFVVATWQTVPAPKDASSINSDLVRPISAQSVPDGVFGTNHSVIVAQYIDHRPFFENANIVSMDDVLSWISIP